MSTKKGGFLSKIKAKIFAKKASKSEDDYVDYDEDDYLEAELDGREDFDDDEELDEESFEASEMPRPQTEEISIDVETLKEQLDDYEHTQEDLEDHHGHHDFQEFNVNQQTRSEKIRAFFMKKKEQIATTLASRGKSNNSTSSFSWDDFVSAIFAPHTRIKIHKFFLALLFCLFAYSIGKNLALFLQGPPKVAKKAASIPLLSQSPNYRGDIAKIKRANLFNAKQDEVVAQSQAKPTPTPLPEIKVCYESTKKTTLPFKLIGTMVFQDSVKSLASVQLRGKKLINIREGQKIENMAEVGRITDQEIVYKNLKTGRCEFVRSSKKKNTPPPRQAVGVVSAKKAKKIVQNQRRDNRIKNEGNKFKIQKSLRDEMLNNIGEVLTQARAIPIKNPDGTLSFKVTEIVPGSIYSMLNVQNGDIIQSINGKPIQNVNEVMSMFGKFKEYDNFQLSVLRNGAEENFEYAFE